MYVKYKSKCTFKSVEPTAPSVNDFTGQCLSFQQLSDSWEETHKPIVSCGIQYLGVLSPFVWVVGEIPGLSRPDRDSYAICCNAMWYKYTMVNVNT